ncbi:MAG: ribonuclease P protein component [Algoriphagus sp.]|uniref:ribonuclease P protein component n=1 Tax=Algoriphagus sp. TaxID=1872435 RepID=UPI00261E1B5B|nr:ribonuclease P protein component [Algoriphagus sp.]MDG1279582.1 ribonuclease P protein component [Algoriphagus sp.]
MNYRLPKSERLHADKLIKELFNEGSSFFLYPFKVLFYVKKEEGNGTAQVLFSVSKKKIKKATQRNLVRRRIKEVYRLNKSLLNLGAKDISIGLVYVSSNLMEFTNLESKIIPILKKISIIIDQNDSKNE